MTSNIDMKLISTFLFGNKFSGFIDLLYTKMHAGDVVISEEDYRQYVDDAVFDLSVNVINFIQQFDVSSHLPTQPPQTQPSEKPQAKKQAPSTSKCTFVLTRGPNKGNDCGKPAQSGSCACSAHAAKSVEKIVEKIVEKHTTQTGDETQATKIVVKPITKKCVYIMSRGARAGDRCDAVVKEGDKCAAHSKSKGPKKDVVPASKSRVKSSKPEHKASDQLILRKDKTRNIIYYPSMGFVFKSSTDLCIIGRVTIENTKPVGDVRELTQSDIDEINTCELPDGGMFKIDDKYNVKQNIEEEAEEEEAEEEEAEEEEAEEEEAEEAEEEDEEIDYS